MFANTLTVTINAVPLTLVRINQDKYSSEYALKNATTYYQLSIAHQKTTAKRLSPASASTPQYSIPRAVDRIRVGLKVTAFATATVPETVYEASSVIPFTDASDPVAARNTVLGLQGLLTSAFVDQLMQGES